MEEKRKKEREISTVNHTYLSKQDIFKLFIQNYYKNEMQRNIMINENFKLSMKQIFGLQFEDLTEHVSSNKKLSAAFNVIDYANALISVSLL